MAPAVRGLKGAVWQKLKSAVFDDFKKEEEWKIMLLDDYTTKLLSLCCKMTDLLAEGITVCPDSLFNKIKSSCAKSIKRCKEINISFFPYESQVFTLNVPDAFYRCYSPALEKTKDKDAVMQVMAEQIVTLCATLDENPGVRYKSGPSDRASKLAQLVEKNLENYYRTDEKSQIKVESELKCLLIFLYKAEGSGGKEKEAILEEDDDLWVKMRHKHIADVIEEIPKLLKEISSKRKEAEGKLSLSALSQLMKRMPQYRKEISRQVVHLNIAEDCMSKFKSNIERLCKTEQDLALGTDAEGQKVKDSMRVLLPVLLNKSHESYDKIRAILLYIFSTNGTTQENLEKLIQNVQIESDSDMIRNWKYLDVPVISTDAIENKLDSKDWPYCSRCPPTWNGSGAVSARQKPKASSREERRSSARLIIFVIGGVTYSEMRSAYEVSEAYKSCEVVIGSTHILTPKRLLDEVKGLSKPKDMVCIKDE
ncbi:Syntaxin-binding protein 3 [Willisornis vidua]|uniref:Syntaxin-binding protein 3 n=1 Tax=Willisornis vidua TaxID=1566151 RepID=A0ABQ9CZB9_9PASS|nr:Syntaxin-binding protein 3 [Willisornis vidua]